MPNNPVTVFAGDGKDPQNWHLRIYNPQDGGIVFNPEQNNVFCAYVADSGTDMRRCEPQGRNPNCIPGCSGKGVNGGDAWCEGRSTNQCAWAPEQLNHMMELALPKYQTAGGHYNEVVMDAFYFKDHLPWSIEAFWYDPARSKDGGALQRAQHSAFLSTFGLTASAVPLLKLEYSSDRRRMFSST